jgi:hypothetical protein
MESNRKFRPTQKRLTCTARIYKKKEIKEQQYIAEMLLAG